MRASKNTVITSGVIEIDVIFDFFDVARVSSTNFVFALHYRFTFGFLIIFSIFTGSGQFFSNAVSCAKPPIDAKIFADKYCYATSLLSVATEFSQNYTICSYPGVCPFEPQDKVIHHRYYPWVSLIFFMQAASFYLIFFFWNSYESKLISSLTLEFNLHIIKESTIAEGKKLILEYFNLFWNKKNHYFYFLVTAETLNFLNVVGQLYWSDWHLNYKFRNYGARFISHALGWEKTSPEVEVFPLMAICVMSVYDISRNIITSKITCTLALNFLVSKVYLFLWFWLVFLAIVSFLVLVWRAVVCAFLPLRIYLLSYSLQSTNKAHVVNICQSAQIGDWIVLHHLSNQMDICYFSELIAELNSNLMKTNERNV